MSRRGEKKGLPAWGIGLIAVALTIIGFYLGFAKRLPFTDRGYEVNAVFSNAQNIRVKSPVRVAGVNVGEVIGVKHLESDGKGEQAAVIEMALKDDALPVREDATMQLRPRLFLEGNLFVDLHPGSPESPELEEGSTIPIAQTSISVQVDQVLTSLQAPVRASLQTFLIEFGDALDKYGGAEGLRDTFASSPDAFRYTAEVNEAFLGTQPGDLTGLIVNFDSFIQALNQDPEQLQDLVTNLSVVLNAFGRESDSLQAAIFELPRLLGAGEPALVKVNRALPALRAFSREILPGTKSASPTLDAANPFIAQLRALVGPDELRGLVADLTTTTPSLAKLSRLTVPFFEQARALSSCFNNVVIPWSETDIPSNDGENSEIVYKETGYGLAGIGGESRSGDANGQYIRVGAGSGTNILVTPPAPGAGPGNLVGNTPFDLLGAEPPLSASAKTPFHPDTPCENQQPPDLRSGGPVAVPGQQAGDPSEKVGVPEAAEPFLEEEVAAREKILAGQAAGTKAGREQAREGVAELQSWYKERLPEYRETLNGGGDE